MYKINIYYLLNLNKKIMRKGLIAMLIAFSFAVVSCGGAKEEATEEVVDTVETEVETVEVPATEEVSPGGAAVEGVEVRDAEAIK